MYTVSEEKDRQESQSDEWTEMMLRYKETKDVVLRNQLVMHYSYIAKSVAAQVYGLSTNFAQIEDVINEGILAIIGALEKYDPSRGASFKVYAYKRVHGAVIDFIRKQDWIPRRVRVNARNMMEAHDDLCNELLREPTPQEVANRLGISMKDYYRNTYEAANAMLFSFEGVIENMTSSEEGFHNAQEEHSPEQSLEQKELLEMLAQGIDELSERERLVITLYYYEHLKLSEISKIMGVTDQRIAQISSRAVSKLRKKILNYMKGEK